MRIFLYIKYEGNGDRNKPLSIKYEGNGDRNKPLSIKYEGNGDRNKPLSVKECLNKISPYLKDIINNLKKADTWKIQLTIANNFIYYIDNDEDRVMHSKVIT